MKNASSSSMWHPVGSAPSSSSYNNQASTPPDVSEEDLERQYAAYRGQFEEWIEKNRNHPDRDAYNRYVNQFKEWEAQVEVNRRAIREWKAAREQRLVISSQTDQASSTNRPNNGTTAVSETSSPPLSTSGKKKKKLKKKKAAVEGATASNNEAENPMMAMMKLMAGMAAATATAPAPAPPPPAMPMDPFSMMMAMTMMMPMMMNTAPASTPEQTSTSKPTSIPDTTKPPPSSFSNGDRPMNQRYEQSDRDRAYRAERSRHQLDRSPYGQRFDDGDRRERGGGDHPDDRGDFWYQRWLANRQHQPGPSSAVDPWLPNRQPSGPVPLWPPGGQSQQMRPDLDRDAYDRGEGPPPYVSRSNFGARDFSMRKQHNQRRWD